VYLLHLASAVLLVLALAAPAGATVILDFEVLRHDDATLQPIGGSFPSTLYAEDGFVIQGTSLITIGTLLDGSVPFEDV
jgi:hypothetical protein